jgi:AcrR family transcriptional regulator
MATAKKKTVKKKVKKHRSYDNSTRQEKVEQSQTKIIEAMVQFLVERKGGDVKIDELAKRTKISQRTIFRFFTDKTALLEATDQYLQSYLQSSMAQVTEMSFMGFAKNVFSIFDRNEGLVMAYMFSPFGQNARDIFRKKLNRILLDRIQSERNIQMTKERERKLALIVTLINAKLWYDVRTDFGYSGAEIGETVEWAISTLLEKV